MVLLQGRPQLHLLTQLNPLLRCLAKGIPAGAQLVKRGVDIGFWAWARSIGLTQIQFPALGLIHLQVRSFICTRPAIREAELTRPDNLLFLGALQQGALSFPLEKFRLLHPQTLMPVISLLEPLDPDML